MPMQLLRGDDSGPGRLGAGSSDLSSCRSHFGRLSAWTPPSPVCRMPAEHVVDSAHPAPAAAKECMGEVVDLLRVRRQFSKYATGTVSRLVRIVGPSTRTTFPRSGPCHFCRRDGVNRLFVDAAVHRLGSTGSPLVYRRSHRSRLSAASRALSGPLDPAKYPPAPAGSHAARDLRPAFLIFAPGNLLCPTPRCGLDTLVGNAWLVAPARAARSPSSRAPRRRSGRRICAARAGNAGSLWSS